MWQSRRLRLAFRYRFWTVPSRERHLVCTHCLCNVMEPGGIARLVDDELAEQEVRHEAHGGDHRNDDHYQTDVHAWPVLCRYSSPASGVSALRELGNWRYDAGGLSVVSSRRGPVNLSLIFS